MDQAATADFDLFCGPANPGSSRLSVGSLTRAPVGFCRKRPKSKDWK
jgi:hypothetical protein